MAAYRTDVRPDLINEGSKVALPLVTQSEMIADISERVGATRQDTKVFLDALNEFVVEAMANGERVKVAGIVVGPAVRPPQKKRMGRNPQTGEEVEIKAKPASVRLRARIVKPLKDAKVPSVKKLQGMM